MQLPAAAYAGAEAFQAERQRLFAAAWLGLGATAQIAAPGAFIAQGIAGWPLFAIRGADGVARGFHNRCRHQQMPVLDKAEGQCEALRCRVHGWTYGLDGRFRDAPPRFAPAEPAAAENDLQPAALIERDGLVFVRIEDGAGDPPPMIATGERPFRAATSAEVTGNWKCMIETGLAGGAWRLAWPLALVAERGDGRLIRLVLPRSFLRTRVIELGFAADPAADALQADAAAAEAWHERRAAGRDEAVAPAVAEFRDAVALAVDPH